ncbi:Aste57867_14591 [Aphanomyces stellatus]|uniref:Aste57867_14591 protein n=1 Tax=Aphanomyces stellatus TaxID=120398 RepID=A0A485L126_9STRA|nr:hypothetical protein As57867_014537 [Aphanomyces stellatus]VFT91410.1 Aste57867_14591 [Aphanomyces stellatus]
MAVAAATSIDSILHSSLFHAAWVEMENGLMECMLAFVSSYQDNPSACQILLGLCGDAFATRFFPSQQSQRFILFEPYMTSETKHALETNLLAQLVAFVAEKLPSLLSSDAMTHLRNHLRRELHPKDAPSTPEEVATRVILLLHGRFARPNPWTPTPAFDPSFVDVMWPTHALPPKLLPPPFDMGTSLQSVQDEAALFDSLIGRSLPFPLRQLLWFRRLVLPSKVDEHRWRLKANQSLLGVSQAHHSPIAALLTRLVHEAPASLCATVMHERLCDLLNLWFVLTKQQGSHLLSIAVPIVTLFPAFDAKNIELASCMLVFLDGFHTCGTSRSDLIATSQRVWRALSTRDPSLFQHIDSIYAHARLDLMEKPYQLMSRWLQVAFVGYLRPSAVDFIWDQSMLSPRGWTYELELFCIDVAVFLATPLKEATSVLALQVIVDTQTRSLISTRDLRRSFQARRSPASIQRIPSK